MKIAVLGANGKMGKTVCHIAQQRGHNIIAIDQHTNTDNIVCDVLIDFSSTTALDTAISICITNSCPLVCGVTGYDDTHLAKLAQLSLTNKVVHRHNFSMGIDAVATLCSRLSDLLPHWQYNIIEQHHSAKVDCPSGTAITLSDNISQPTDIHSIRAGTTYGIHTIVANGQHEYITISHHACSRDIFAIGAVHCAEQLVG